MKIDGPAVIGEDSVGWVMPMPSYACFLSTRSLYVQRSPPGKRWDRDSIAPGSKGAHAQRDHFVSVRRRLENWCRFLPMLALTGNAGLENPPFADLGCRVALKHDDVEIG